MCQQWWLHVFLYKHNEPANWSRQGYNSPVKAGEILTREPPDETFGRCFELRHGDDMAGADLRGVRIYILRGEGGSGLEFFKGGGGGSRSAGIFIY